VPTNQQRREAERRRLQRQLEQRREKEIARRRLNVILAVVGTVVVVAAAVIITVVATSGGSGKKTPSSEKDTVSTQASTTAAPSTPAPSSSATVPPPPKATGPAVSFDGVTVGGARDLKGEPQVTSKGTTTPTKLAFKDLVVGTGAAAKAGATVSVQYVGALYKTGTVFDASWVDTGKPATFPLTSGSGGVITGFREGIGGTTGVPPMKVGGRRIIIMPAALGYGSTANGSIPANSPLVFVVDLTKA
jgi:cytoskeletal protein RodZ